MILHNRNYIEKINDLLVSKMCFFSNTPYSNVYSSTIVDDKLYVNVKHNRILDFNNESTTDIQLSANEYANDCLVFDIDMIPQNLINYIYYNVSSNPIFYNFDIKSDVSGNTYHIGYVIGDPLNNVGSKIYFLSPSSTTENVTQLLRGSNQYYSHILKFNDSYQITTAITYLNSGGQVIVNDLININDYNYVFLTSNKINTYTAKYYYKFNDNSQIQICSGDTYHNFNTCTIVKYSNDFKTISWYNKFYASTKPTPTTWSNTKNILTNINAVEKSFNIVEDFDKEYIYTSIRVDIGSDGLLYTNGLSDRIVTNLDSSYYSFVVAKFDLNGLKIWATPIYYDSSHNDNFLTKMVYHNDNIYLTIRTNGSIIVDDVTYGTTTKWKFFTIKIDKNGNYKWVKELGGINNDDYTTDIIIYNGIYGEYLLVSGYYNNSTRIGTYDLITNGVGTYVAKINIYSGVVVGLVEKTSTESIIIKSINIIDDSLFVCGEFIGSSYIGGKRLTDYKTTIESEIFIEEIKINSF